MNKKRKAFRLVEPDRTQFIGEQYLDKPAIQVFRYDAGDYTEIKEISDPGLEIPEIQPDKLLWVNLHGIHDTTIVKKICEKFDIHRLAIEDILDTSQRPKIQEYEHFVYVSIQSILSTDWKNFDTEHISFVLGQNFVLSFQEKANDHFDHVRERIRKNIGYARQKKGDYLLYLMLEAMLDNYYRGIEQTGEEVKLLTQKKDTDTLKPSDVRNIELFKDILSKIKRSIVPLKDSVSSVEKIHTPFIEQANLKFYSDLKDHCFVLLDEIESQHQQLESRINLFFSFQSYRMNEIMKVLTIVATMFIPLTFLAGIYGMNFTNMPELDFRYGYFILLGIMVAVIAGLILFFKHKKWL